MGSTCQGNHQLKDTETCSKAQLLAILERCFLRLGSALWCAECDFGVKRRIMRVLIYGAGVIGSLYAVLFSEAGVDTSVYARGLRLEALQRNGLRYEKNGAVCTANVCVLDILRPNDIYDFIFLTVRENQLHEALAQLRENQSPYIATMVNSIEDYGIWEQLCGDGRILPAFPGAGGGFEDGVLHAALTPSFIQPTTFGILTPEQQPQAQRLKKLFRRAHIPYQQVRDMHAWQLCHLGMVVPIADAYYEADDPANAGTDRLVMDHTAKALRENFRTLAHNGVHLSPAKMQIFRFLPLPVLRLALKITFQSRFGDVFMYRHAIKAPNEMRQLHEQFYAYLSKIQNRNDCSL